MTDEIKLKITNLEVVLLMFDEFKDLLVAGDPGYLAKFDGDKLVNSAQLSSTISDQTLSTKFLREDGTFQAPSYTTNTWRPIQANGENVLTDTATTVNFTGSGGASVSYSNGTFTINTSTNYATTTQGDKADDAHSEIVTFGLGVGSATTVTNLPVNVHTTIVTIANGQTNLNFTLNAKPESGRELHYIIDNSINNSKLTISIPHGTTGGITYVNTNDVASGSMEIEKNKMGEINVIYSNKAYIRYIGS